ncbi:hypothetical protein ACOME3_002019 [Neoechinorhynchus agilis]
MCCNRTRNEETGENVHNKRKMVSEEHIHKIVKENQKTALLSHNELLDRLMPMDLRNISQSELESKTRAIFEENAKRRFEAMKSHLGEYLVKQNKRRTRSWVIDKHPNMTFKKKRYSSIGNTNTLNSCCFERCQSTKPTAQLSLINWNDLSNEQRSQLIGYTGLPKWNASGQYLGCDRCKDLVDQVINQSSKCNQKDEHQKEMALSTMMVCQDSLKLKTLESTIPFTIESLALTSKEDPSYVHRSAFRAVKKTTRNEWEEPIISDQLTNCTLPFEYLNETVKNQTNYIKPTTNHPKCDYQLQISKDFTQHLPTSMLEYFYWQCMSPGKQFPSKTMNMDGGSGGAEVSRRKRKSQPKKHPNHRERWNNGESNVDNGKITKPLFWKYFLGPPIDVPRSQLQHRESSVKSPGMDFVKEEEDGEEFHRRFQETIAMRILSDLPISDEYYRDLNERVKSKNSTRLLQWTRVLSGGGSSGTNN